MTRGVRRCTRFGRWFQFVEVNLANTKGTDSTQIQYEIIFFSRCDSELCSLLTVELNNTFYSRIQYCSNGNVSKSSTDKDVLNP